MNDKVKAETLSGVIGCAERAGSDLVDYLVLYGEMSVLMVQARNFNFFECDGIILKQDLREQFNL